MALNPGNSALKESTPSTPPQPASAGALTSHTPKLGTSAYQSAPSVFEGGE